MSCRRCNPSLQPPHLSMPGTSAPLLPMLTDSASSRGYGASVSNPEAEGNGYDLVSGPSDDRQSLLRERGKARCFCHEEKHEKGGSKKARNKLIIACLIALTFTLAEVAGEEVYMLKHYII